MERRQIFSWLVLAGVLLLMSLWPVKAAPQSNSISIFPSSNVGGSMMEAEEATGLLDTFSLSFVGNLNFANAIEGVTKIVEGVSSCKRDLLSC